MNKVKISIILVSILSIFVFWLIVNRINSTYAVDFTYSNELVENVASVIASENGCGRRETFVYQLILGADLLNGHYYWNHHNDITMDSLCYTLKHGWRNDGYYCNYTFEKLYANRSGTCTSAQEEQLKLAARMVLSGSFNIPKNVYGAAEKSIMDQLGTEWVSYRPETWSDIAYFFYPKNEALSTVDRYENPVRQDFEFYKQLSDCLYDNPTLYGAHNNCSTTPAIYKVYLYPNGGTFSDGTTTAKTFEYTETTLFSKFPEVKKTNCELDGWNLEDGTKYYSDVRPTDNGKKLYARWNCTSSSSSSSSSNSSNSSNDTNTYTVTFIIDNNIVFHQEQVKENTKVIFPSKTPDREGYSFEGWITKDGEKFDFNTRIKDNITLYASWKNKTISSYNSSHIVASSTNPQSSSRQEVENPQTGIFGLIIFVVLMIPTSLAVFVYYQNYIIKSKSQ